MKFLERNTDIKCWKIIIKQTNGNGWKGDAQGSKVELGILRCLWKDKKYKSCQVGKRLFVVHAKDSKHKANHS